MRLAMYGGEPAVKGPIPRFNVFKFAPRFKEQMIQAVDFWLNGSLPTSGYLAGSKYGGTYVQALERTVQLEFNALRAVACNSATSGLYAAACAIRDFSDFRHPLVYMPALGMSALPAAFHLAGWQIQFIDIDRDFQLDVEQLRSCLEKNARPVLATCVAVVNLFGIPARLQELRALCDEHKLVLLEDNAQAYNAIEHGNYTGTVGDISVLSFNVHKHINAGEGGFVLVNHNASEDYGTYISHFINHGEAADWLHCGLNLRMTEMGAAWVLNQLQSVKDVIASRNALAGKLIAGLELDWNPREGLLPTWYNLPIWARQQKPRDWFIQALHAEGVDFVHPYARPFYKFPVFQHDLQIKGYDCPRAELWDQHGLVAELMAADPSDEQIDQIIEAFMKVYTHAYRQETNLPQPTAIPGRGDQLQSSRTQV